MTLNVDSATRASSDDPNSTPAANTDTTPRTEIEALSRNSESDDLTMYVTDWSGPFTATIRNIEITTTTYVVALNHDDGMYRLLAPVDDSDDSEVRMEVHTPSGWLPLTTVTEIVRA